MDQCLGTGQNEDTGEGLVEYKDWSNEIQGCDQCISDYNKDKYSL